MPMTFPRVRISFNDAQGGAEGELNLLSLGFGIHEGWTFASLFGAPFIYGLSAPSLPAPTIFIISLVVFAATLLLFAVTDQRFLSFYTRKRIILASAAMSSLGSFLMIALGFGNAGNLPLTVLSGILTGVGSGMLTVFWGTAYSRHSSASITLNAVISVIIAVILYTFLLNALPRTFAAVITSLLPLFELPILLSLTPVSYALRHAVPIFNQLPVRKLPFSIKYALPMLLFGYSLGATSCISTQIILPGADLVTQTVILIASFLVAAIAFIIAFSTDKRGHWDSLFRPIVPLIALAVFFFPQVYIDSSSAAVFMVLMGFICFETLMWVFLSEMSQEFRISPIFLFGMGRCFLAIGSLAGSMVTTYLGSFENGWDLTATEFMMTFFVALILAYAFLPRVRDIKSVIMSSKSQNSASIATINNRIKIAAGPGVYEVYPSDNTPAEDIPTKELVVASSEDEIIQEAEARPAEATSTTQPSPEIDESMEEHKQSDENESTRRNGRFKSQCEIIADRYLLSRRETEVMFLLAKGYNAALIQEKLCISKSTAKTHIGHIYRKLDIHNQQELLRMVADMEDNPE